MRPPTRPAWPSAVCPGLVAAAGITVLDTALGEEVGLLPLFAVGPALTACCTAARRVLRCGLVSFLLCAAVALYDDLLFTRRGLVALISVLLVTAASAVGAQARVHQERRAARERRISAFVQSVILSPTPEDTGPAGVAASYVSATEDARIGGDFYEVTPVRGGMRVIIGDVQGKGLNAVRTASVVLGAFRESAPDAAGLDGVAFKIGCALRRRGADEQFVTAILAELDDRGRLTLLNFGHPPPLVIRPESHELAHPPHPAMPFGLEWLDPDLPDPSRVTLAPGDRVLLYTDGLAEARDAEDAFYPLVQRTGLLRGAALDDSLVRLRSDVHDHTCSGVDDDSALLLLEYREPQHPPLPPLPTQERPHGEPYDRSCEVCAVTDCPLRGLLVERGPSGGYESSSTSATVGAVSPSNTSR